jgi:deoxyadenosine/deoxycytidine kinase
MKMGKVVIVEGLIGAGKSSLSQELAGALGDKTLLLMEPDEKDDANPYLASFYEDQDRWAFTMQAHLLQARYRMHLQAQWHAMNKYGDAVMDRSYFGDTAFARLQLAMGAMSTKEFDTYKSLYHAMTASVLLPNVCVRLLVSPEVAAHRIHRRMELQTGRKCENVISLKYLEDLDTEISHVTDVLRHQGVTILDVPWDVERNTEGDRKQAVDGLASRIQEVRAMNPLLDYHRRTL